MERRFSISTFVGQPYFYIVDLQSNIDTSYILDMSAEPPGGVSGGDNKEYN